MTGAHKVAGIVHHEPGKKYLMFYMAYSIDPQLGLDMKSEDCGLECLLLDFRVSVC
jgi:hypothetical protein